MSSEHGSAAASNKKSNSVEGNSDNNNNDSGNKKQKKPKEQQKKQHMLVVKYYEERDNYAKIIPRSFGYLVKTRHVAQFNAQKPEKSRSSGITTVAVPLDPEDLRERIAKLHEVTGREIVDLIKNDDKWLQRRDPITQVSLYDEDTSKFMLVSEGTRFPLVHKRRETVLTFHIKRTLAAAAHNVPALLVQSTVTFSDCKSAESWVSSIYGNPQMTIDDLTAPVAIRYFDIYHHGFTRLYKSQEVPVERTGRCIVKLMIEKRRSEAEISELIKQAAAQTVPQSLIGLDIYDFIDDGAHDEEESDVPDDPDNGHAVQGEEGDCEQEQEQQHPFDEHNVALDDRETEALKAFRGYSDMVDSSKLPFQVIKSPENIQREKARQIAWKKITVPESPQHAKSSNIKPLIRKGVPDILRGQVYIGIIGSAQVMKQKGDFYETAFNKLYGNYGKGSEKVRIENIDPRMVAEYGGKIYNDIYCCLNENGIKATKRILCVAADQNPDVDYCPCLPEVVQLLLMYMNEHYCYATIHNMLAISRKNNYYFRLNKMQNALFVESFCDLIQQKLPHVHSHMTKIDFDLSKIAQTWFDRLFVSFLPFHIILRILDGFISEGCKMLYRTGYTVLKMLEKKILKHQSSSFLFSLLCVQAQEAINEVEFFKIAQGLALKRDQMQKLDEKNRAILDFGKLSTKVTQFVKPKIHDHSEIISDMSQWELIVTWLPYAQRVRKMYRLFSTSKDGYSLSTLYSAIKDCGPCLLLIQASPVDDEFAAQQQKKDPATPHWQSENGDDVDIVQLIKDKNAKGESLRKEIKAEEDKRKKDGGIVPPVAKEMKKKKKDKHCIFGAYCGESFSCNCRYEGTPDTFLFSLYPVEAQYKWTRKNDYFALGKKDGMALGGGGEGPGLTLDECLNGGTSHRCLTFENEPLGGSTAFVVLKIEVYHFSV